jgi:HD superfamily phosphohydrolase
MAGKMSLNFEVLKDPVHGYIQLFEHEKQIVDTAIFQRLRRIKQNTGVHYAYPGATHSRFSHSLGVMHVAGVFAEHLLKKIPRISEPRKRKYYYLFRLWGLTHDIGHGPFSHTFDDVVFQPNYNTDHEMYGSRILRNCIEIPCRIETEDGVEIEIEEVASLFEVKSIEDWPLKTRIGRSDVKETIFYYICRGAYSADIIDFLLRDSYFTGAGYGNIDWERLVFSSIPINDKIVLDPRGEEAFDSLILARLFMFSTVYYHRTTRAANKVINQFLNEATPKLNLFKDYVDDPNNYKNLDEDSLLFNPQLSDSLYRKQLLERKIPYTKFEEQKMEIGLDISDRALSNTYTQEIRSKLPSNLRDLPEYAFFVDTPTFKLNPLFGEQEQYIFIQSENQPEHYKPRRVLETNWGSLQKKVLLMRLYIHDDFQQHSEQIVNAFTQRHSGTHV